MDELQKLYDVLVREGYYTKSYDDFANQWNDEAYQDKVYGVVSRDGLYTKDKNSFLQKYPSSVKKKDQSSTGSNQTQPGSGSQNAQSSQDEYLRRAREAGWNNTEEYARAGHRYKENVSDEELEYIQPTNKKVIYRGDREDVENQLAKGLKEEIAKSTVSESTKPIQVRNTPPKTIEEEKSTTKIRKLSDITYMNENPDDFNSTWYDIYNKESQKSGDPEKYSKDLKDKYADDFIDEEFKQEYSLATELRLIEDKMKKEIEYIKKSPFATTPEGQKHLKSKIDEYTNLIKSKTLKLDEVRKANNQKYQDRINEIDNLFKTGEAVMREDALTAEKNQLIRRMSLIKLAENPLALKEQVGESEYNKIPGDTADEKLNNYLNTRLTIYDQFKSEAVDAAFDRNKYFGSKKDKADAVYNTYTNLQGELKDLYYLSTLKRYVNPEDRSNFIQAAGEGFLGSFVEGRFNFDDVGKKHSENLQKIAQEAGIQYSDQDKSFIEYTSAPAEPWSGEWWGDMTGTSSAFMAELALTRKPTNAVLSGAGALIKSSPKISKIAQGALSRYDKLGKTSQKFVNNVFNAAEEGVYFEGTNQMLHNGESSELTFLTGFTGGLLAAPVNAVLKKTGNLAFKSFNKGAAQEISSEAVSAERAAVLEAMGAQKDEVKTILSQFVKPTAKNDAVYMIAGTFGKETPKVINLLENVGTHLIARPTGEVAQEFGEQLASIYQSTSNEAYGEFKKEFERQFPDADAATQFVVASYMMGVGFGGGNFIGDVFIKKSKTGYDQLTPDQKKIADKAIAEADSEIKNKEAEVLSEQEMATPERKKSKEEVDWDNGRAEIETKISESNSKISSLEGMKQKIYDKYGITNPKTQDISGLSSEDAEKIETINGEIQKYKKGKAKEEIDLSLHDEKKPVITEEEEAPIALHADDLINRNKENAVQEPNTEEVLPREQGATTETGGQPQGVGQSVQGEVVAQEGQEVSQEGLTPEQQVSQDAGDVIAEINPPSTLAASVYPVIGEIETAIENNQPVNEEQLTDAENKLYSLLDEIDSRQDLTPDQKQRMANVIENRITKLQNYDNRTRTETSTTTQAVAAGRVEKTQKPNERATIPVRTVAEEGIDVTYDGRPGRVELRDGQYVFVPKKLGAVQARPIVIGEAAQVNANSSFAGVENPTKGPNNSVANITLPNGSTLSILNDDLSIDIGLEIAKKEIGAAPQSLFDVVFDEVVSEQKKEVPVQKKEEAQVETTEEVEQPTQEAQQPVQEARPEQADPYTGVTPADRSLKQKYKDDLKKRRILDQAQRIANALGLDVPIFIHETTDDYNSALSERGLEMSRDSSNGKFVYSEDGSVKEIHINLSEANERTIAHEAAHAVLFKAFGDNQALFLDFKDRLANILQDSTVKELEAFANNAAYVSQGVSAEEFLAELAGKMTAEGNRIPKTTLQKIAKLINEFVGKITKGKVKVFEDTANTADVIDFFNSMADSFAKGKLMDTKSQKIVNTSSELKSKNRLGGIFEADLMSESDLKKLEDEGYLIQNAKIEELDGETVISMFPDNKMVGDLSYGTYNEDTEVDGIQYKKGDKRIVLQGNGGLHFALKYNKDGTFWASTPVLAERFKNVVNKIFDKYPGKSVKVVVFKSTDFKVLSSRDGMAAAMDIIEAAVQDGDIPLSVFRSALNNAVKEEQDKEGIKLFSGKLSAKQLHTTIKDYFINANDKSFKKRIDVGKSIISGVFGSQDENINFENLSKKLDIPLNKSGKINIKDATPRLGNVQEESLMENVPVESAVAYIEIPSKLIIEDESNIAPKDRKHISYPGVMKTEDGQRVTVHMLSERDNYKDILSSVNDGEIKTSEKIEDNIPLRDLKHGANHAGARNIPYSIVKINTKLKSKSQQNLVEKAGMSSRMTEDDQGNYLFYHFSPTKISSIDPKYFGRNVNRTGRDERPGLNISMYYTEPGVKDVSGDYGYVVRIPKDQVYPFNKDPLDLYDKAKAEFNKKFPGQAFDPNKQVAFIAKEAAKLGYPMTVAKWANNKLRAQTTEKMQVEYYTKPEKGGGISVNPEIEQFEVNQKARRKDLKSKSQQETVLVNKYESLPGAPKSGPIKDLVDVAENYAKKFNVPYTRQAEYVEVDEDFARRIADAYEKMKHDPSNPKVKEAYSNLIQQTKDQYNALIEAGYKFSFFDSNTDPYDGNPMEAMRDLRNNKQMAVYGTYDGYGTEGITGASIEDNPMLENTGLQWVDQKGIMHDVTANDLFRAVHDAFGHGLEGAGFRARGEENAWQAHARLFTGSAVAAITSETRGQNSWLNFGPFGEKNRTAKLEDTVFAEQKTGLMPEWTWTENVAPAMPVKSKSQETAIPKAKAQESSMVSEMNQAMNKTGLAKENAVKRFIEKYGQNGLVAKEIIDNFDKIQEQLGITKICNI